jgi:hypothetical protein
MSTMEGEIIAAAPVVAEEVTKVEPEPVANGGAAAESAAKKKRNRRKKKKAAGGTSAGTPLSPISSSGGLLG